MAESIARSLGGSGVEARSAGLAPLGWIAEQTIAALDALGHEARGLASQGLDAVDVDEFDIVVSLLGERGLDHIPQGRTARREAWPIPDPFGEDEKMYLNVARQLEDRIRGLLAEETETELFPG
jgi:protein-tyrosine-phosphatase